jgi:homoserine dehydrogenase
VAVGVFSIMQNINIMQLGLGGVGLALLGQFQALPAAVRSGLTLVGVADSSAALYQADGLDGETLTGAIELKRAHGQLANHSSHRPSSALEDCLTSGPTIIVDVTATSATVPLLRHAAEQGCGVVLANKRPLCEDSATWRLLTGDGRLRYEATVGAGLPVISTLAYLQATGDRVLSVQGVLSGTLSYLFTRIEDGDSFSAALRAAHELNYTEPDPRDDLGGMDVARKALILARTIGIPLELDDIAVQALYPPDMAGLPVADFLAQSAKLDRSYQQQQREAAREGKVLRYLATVEPGNVRIGLAEVNPQSPAGALRGTDNLLVIRTERYTSPMRIAGPGAGPEVTAAGVLGDILDLAVAMRAGHPTAVGRDATTVARDPTTVGRDATTVARDRGNRCP